MIREKGPQLWFWEEVRAMSMMHFRFRDELYPIDLVTKLATNMIVSTVPKFP